MPNRIIKHRSVLLRKLKDVDMYLQHNKVTNLELACERINGIVIEPGQTFSLWKLVGTPSARRGYKEGLVLHNGSIGKGIGGGLCQLGNLLYWMILHSELAITERWRHGYDVFPDVSRTIPFGCGATLAYNYIDLQFRNDTDQAYQLFVGCDNTHLNGELLCADDPCRAYEVYETDHQFKLQWWGGYTRHNRIWRSVTDSTSNEVWRELLTENHAIMMYSPLLHPPTRMA